MGIKREKWGNRYVIAVREGNKIATWRPWSRKYTLRRAMQVYAERGTLNERLEKREYTLVNVKETEITAKSSYIKSDRSFKKEKGARLQFAKNVKSIQYIVKLFLNNGKVIVARSLNVFNRDGSRRLSNNEARDMAWNSALSRLSSSFGGKYDADDSYDMIGKKVKEIREGWVYYRDI